MATYTHLEIVQPLARPWVTYLGTSYVATASQIVIEDIKQFSNNISPPTGGQTWLLGNFTVSGGTVTGGTITSMLHKGPNGGPTFENITGFSVNVMSFLNAPNADAKFALVLSGVDTLNGYSGDDHLNGYGGNLDVMKGGAGHDTYVVTSAANQVIEADGQGADTIETALNQFSLPEHVENLTFTGTGSFFGGGNEGSNVIEGGASDDTLYGYGGDDSLSGWGGSNHLYGGTGNDTYFLYSAGNVVVEGFNEGDDKILTYQKSFVLPDNVEDLWLLDGGMGTGNELANLIVGDFGGDTLYGLGGDDTLRGDQGDDKLYGGDGDDTLKGEENNDLMVGGAGNDTYYVREAGDVVQEQAGEGTDWVYAYGVASYTLPDNVENLAYALPAGGFPSQGITLTGNNLGNVLFGGEKGDTLNGLGGNDQLFGNEGKDTLDGGAGDDFLMGGAGGDTLIGGDGIDTASYAFESSGVNIALSSQSGSGAAQGDSLIGIENVTGTSYDDNLFGHTDNNVLMGGGGNDNIHGWEGDDVLIGGSGGDTLNGYTGNDTASYVGSLAGVTVNLSFGIALGGDAQGDTFAAIDNLRGSAFADILAGDGSDNVLEGGAGADQLIGNGGNDTASYEHSGAGVFINLGAGFALGGDAAGDTLTGIKSLTGSAFADTLIGDSGANRLDGGLGVDMTFFSGPRSAYTFAHVGNKLLVSGPDGADTLTSIEKMLFSDGTTLSAPSASYANFDGDTRSDILWRNDNGAVSIWDSGQIGKAHVVSNAGVVPNAWHVSGKGDFDSNGKSDILWRNDDGSVSIWDDGAIGKAHAVTGPGVVPTSWHIVGVGDFDGNLKSDILWQNDNGAVSVWDDGAIGNAHIVANAGVVPADWHIAETGDFDGNGKSDILWRNDNGAVSIWDNGAIGNAHIVANAGVVPADWHVAGTGDFDGNGKSDILWRNDNGAVSIWDDGQITGAHVISGAGVVSNAWYIADIGDYDGNRQSDILWRNDNGAVSIWDDGQIAGVHVVSGAGVVPNDWHIA